jgi:AMMECR1 domain-containing protein
MLTSTKNPRFENVSNDELAALYVSIYKSRDCDTMTDEQLDSIESELFWIDDELCARGLDLPSTK